MKKKLLLPIFLILLSGFALGQEQGIPSSFWLGGGMGQSHSEAFHHHSFVGGAGFYFSQKQQLLSVQYNHFWEVADMGEMRGNFNEWKIQYGWINAKKNDQFFVTGGLAYTECNHFRETFTQDGMSVLKDPSTQTSFAFVIETGVNFVVNKHFGIGMSAFGNFNKNALTAGYRISALFGIFDHKREKGRR